MADTQTALFPGEQPGSPVERLAYALYRIAGGLDAPRMSSASDREFWLPRAQALLDARRTQTNAD